MTAKSEAAVARHDKGYNCSQSVACAFAEELGMDEVAVFRMMEGLGRGLGCRDGDCGALIGACAVVGMARSDANLEAPASKQQCYDISARIYAEFVEACGSPTCRVLRGTDTGVVLTPCGDCIARAAEIVERALLP